MKFVEVFPAAKVLLTKAIPAEVPTAKALVEVFPAAEGLLRDRRRGPLRIGQRGWVNTEGS